MPKTILAMGQSNCVGITPGGVWGIPSSVKVWNCTGNTTAMTGLGNAFVTANQAAAPFYNGGNNMMVHCCRYLAEEFGEEINLIIVASAGKSISWWVDGAGTTGALYARMEAVLAAAGVAKVDAFLWHQGEADNAAPTGYPAAWGQLLNRMTTDGYIDAETPIVLGETIVQNTPINAVLRGIADADPRIGIADISTFPLAPDLHFSGPSYVRAGLEYAREMMKLPGPFSREPPAFENVYVSGAGRCGLTLPSGAFVKVPLKGENGRKSLFDANGAFVADRFGVWGFSARGCAWAQHTSLSLLDDAGAFLQSFEQMYSASGSYKPVVSGNVSIALGPGDKVHLGLFQATGAAVSVSIQDSSLMNRLTVKFLGAE